MAILYDAIFNGNTGPKCLLHNYGLVILTVNFYLQNILSNLQRKI